MSLVAGDIIYMNYTYISVEYLDLSDSGQMNASVYWSGLSWTKHKQLKLSEPRFDHVVVRVGSCLIVSGGHNDLINVGGPFPRSVEILDTNHDKVWVLPPQTNVSRSIHSMVALSNGILTISGFSPNSCEILSLIDKNSALFKRLSEKSHLLECNQE